jgi:hypothetical protein
MIKNACFHDISNLESIPEVSFHDNLVDFLLTYDPNTFHHLPVKFKQKCITQFFFMPTDIQQNQHVLEYALRCFDTAPTPLVDEIAEFFCELLKTNGGLLCCVYGPTDQMIKNACCHDMSHLKEVEPRVLRASLILFLTNLDPSVEDYISRRFVQVRLIDSTVIEATSAGSLKCIICLAEFCSKADLGKLAKTKCNHYFHSSCVDIWCKHQQTCPCCRTELQE